MSHLYSLDPCGDARWSRFLDNRADASVFHTSGWLEALRRTYGYAPVVYTMSPPGDEIEEGIVFCRINTWLSAKRLVSVPFSDHAAVLSDNPTFLQDTVQFLREQEDTAGYKCIEIRPTTLLNPAPDGLVQSAVFYRHQLCLDKELDGLYKSFHKNCVRRKIARAERVGLSYTEGNNAELTQRFYRLLLVTHRRHGVPSQPIAWFLNLMDCLGDGIKIRVASANGVDVASIITLTHKKMMVYKYGCSDAKYHNLGGVVFLFWRAIQDAKSRGLTTLDMGRSDCDNSGLIRFKEHWATERSRLVYWGSPSRLYSNARRWALKAARSTLTRMPTGALRTMGQLLYRHMG